MMRQEALVDVVIVGGGIAGLWLLTRIRQAGFSAILFESGSFGSGQTIKSQGIIHGGLKYALQGALTNEARSLIDMPARWASCLNGTGDINLSDVHVLSHEQQLFAPNKFTAKLAGFFASKGLASMVQPLKFADYPTVFQQSAFKGEVYALKEMVLDVPSLLLSLVKRNQDAVFKIEPLSIDEMHVDHQQALKSLTVYQNGKALTVHAKQYIFAAGGGNELLLKKCEQPSIAMQRRPLHMVMLKLKGLPQLYAHCLGFGMQPRVTITTHDTKSNERVWYLGGLLAEEGVARTRDAQIMAAHKEMKALFPWLSFNEAEWATTRIDRAEAKQANGLKPEGAYFKAIQNQLLVWPTKLAFAPLLADNILNYFRDIGFTHTAHDVRELRAWPMPAIAKPIWEEVPFSSLDKLHDTSLLHHQEGSS